MFSPRGIYGAVGILKGLDTLIIIISHKLTDIERTELRLTAWVLLVLPNFCWSF